ncbi:D-alanyl-D-alanine carboxypeptidase/D-alanyl-D-alanine endopeptidase [Algivirga pacifica]|uniref:Serine-type D-Ala-D-Ala carboxypeptidase n=1 Tax=Algivirga pacifica TaxID=1162670 RepID=A0ABP9DHE5_9BACT
MKLIRVILLLSPFLILSAFSLFNEEEDLMNTVKRELKALQQEKKMQGAALGMSIWDASTGKEVMSYRSEEAMAPASVMKLVTTSTALRILGADFRFKTTIATDGSIDANGVLNGNLYLIGGGDPQLDSMDLALINWDSLGIQKINGAVVGDARIFATQQVPSTWVWQDLGNYYGTGASGLSFNENQYALYFSSKGPGMPTKVVGVEPQVPQITFFNEVVGGKVGSGDNAYIYGSPYSYEKYLRGTITPYRDRFKIKGSVPDPAFWAAWTLHDLLIKKGISIEGKPTTCRLSPELTPTELTTLSEVQSAPLHEIVKETNQKSVNLFAEVMLKMIGYQKKNEGTTAAGAEAVEEYWESQGLSLNGFFMEDGSGLSRFNAVPPALMSQIILKMKYSEEYDAFFESLAVSGESGTFKYLCKGETAHGRVFGKSGTVKRVKCYAGIIKSASGKEWVFTIMANNYGLKTRSLVQRMEEIFNLLAS